MKKIRFVSAGILATAAAAAGSLLALDAPPEPRRDVTLMRPELAITRPGGKLKIRGAMRVLRPVSSGRDHAVIIRLTVAAPGGGPAVHEEDLSKIDYRRDHERDVAYPVRADLDLITTGLDVKVAAVDAAGHEFASVVDHGAPRPVGPGPSPRDGR